MTKIKTLETILYRFPLPEPVEAAAAGVMSEFELVMVRLRNTDGVEGSGYTALMVNQGAAVAKIIENVCADIVKVADPRKIEWIWSQMWKTHHYAGRGAPFSFAIAAVDTALWDLRGNTLEEPLWRLLGGYNPTVRAYAGNIDLNFPVDKLLEGASKSLEAGFRSIKMRLGKPTLREDIARVAAMREHLGPDVELMTDANEAWRPDQALRALRALRDFDLVWVEEPIQPYNFSGYAHLRANGGIPLSAGENLHTIAEFAALISAGGVDFPEPDLTTCGGITPWIKIAHLADAHGLPITSHGAHDIHVHLLAAVPNNAYLEVHGFGLDPYIEHPIEIREGFATAPDRPGHGMIFDWEGLEAFRVN